jgi:hypothetical protein
MRVNINGFPQAEQGGRRLSTSLYILGGSTIRFIRRFPAEKGELAKGIVRPIKASISVVVILLNVSRQTHRSRASFRLPQCVSFRSDNTRSLPWFIALSIAIRASINHAGEPSAALINISTAICQWRRFCWALGSFRMWSAASWSVRMPGIGSSNSVDQVSAANPLGRIQP